MKAKANSNAIIIHGGGLVDPSKDVILRLAKGLAQKDVYDNVYIGKYSFESLYTKSFWTKYDDVLEANIANKRGTYFGTSRGIDLTDPILSNKAITCLIEANVKTIIVAGGDGSSRQVAEISDTFIKNGINIIFAVPLTIDGINGGISIGINEAVRESIRQIENIVSTAFQTRDNGTFGVVMVELQGRNRDDIIANVLRKFVNDKKVSDFGIETEDILLKVVPANYETDEVKLLEEINSSKQRTLILVSEGAKIKINDIAKKINRKVRTLVIGYSSQSNGLTRPEEYYDWIDFAGNIIAKSPFGLYCIVNYGAQTLRKVPIDYYARLNPRFNQIAVMDLELEELIKSYMAT